MTKLKFFAFGLFTLCAICLFAQKTNHHNPEQREQKQLERMTKQLNLSPTQMSEVKTLQEKFFVDAKNKDANKAARTENRAEIKTKLASILSAEQMQKLDAMEAEQKAKRTEKREAKATQGEKHEKDGKAQDGNRKGKRDGANKKDYMSKRFEKMSAELALTDAQKTQVQAIFDSEMAAREKQQAERRAIRTEKKTAFESELKQLLNPEQLEKFNAIKAKRQNRKKGKQ